MTSDVRGCISYQEFKNIFFVIGRAVEVTVNLSAQIPAYLIRLYLSSSLMHEHKSLYKKEVYTSSAQLCANHEVEEILNKDLLIVMNFPRKQIGKTMSDCLVTGVQKDTPNTDEKRDSTVFVKPSSPVEAGLKAGLLGEVEFVESNPRNLSWPEFLKADLRIGSIEECLTVFSVEEDINRVFFRINLGFLGRRTCIGHLHPSVEVDSLLGKQVLVLANLDADSKEQLFSASSDESILCTFGGRAVLEPAKPVENGFKLA